MVGRYARYELTAGALLLDDNVQDRPLVTPGRALISFVAETSDVPREVGAGDEVALILVADGSCATVAIVDATVVTTTVRSASSPGAGPRSVSVAVEVDATEVAAVATAARVVVARPNSAEVADLLAAPASQVDRRCVSANAAGDPGESPAADPAVQQPVPTGVVPLEPSEVLLDPAG